MVDLDISWLTLTFYKWPWNCFYWPWCPDELYFARAYGGYPQTLVSCTWWPLLLSSCSRQQRFCQTAHHQTSWKVTDNIVTYSIFVLPLWGNTKWCKKLKNDWNPGNWVLIWECSARAFQWIPIQHGLDGFQKTFLPCALDESSLSIGRVNPFHAETTFVHSRKMQKVLKAI